MPETTGVEPQKEFADIRGRREALHGAMLALEAASAGPADDDWPARIAAALDLTQEVLAEHVERVEAGDGLFAKIASDAPHTLPRVETLRGEHAELQLRTRALAEACRSSSASPADLREGVLELVTSLSRHRHAGADLLYEAYQVDVSAAD